KEQGRKSLLDGVPRVLPALQRAERLQQKAASVGFDWSNIADVWKKVEEEIGELKHEQDQNAPKEKLEDEFGDILFSLVNYARFLKVNPEDALRRTSEKFIKRFQYIETELAAQGKDITSTSLAEMDALWEQAKKL
ncbi:MAG TPA: MazG family protein, partial [Candidatus Kapabacteria bacterium]|nr:MazG family protein [Candidatus Kapabacteria bacterium]